MDPEIKSLLDKSKPITTPGIYEFKSVEIDKSKPTLFIFCGPSGSGKSTFIKKLSEKITKVKTATTRKERRPEEDDNSFLWINETKFEDESFEDFQVRMEMKYDLLESNLHAGNIYGTPRSELEKALSEGKAIISTENNGAKALQKKLANQVNMITFFVLPDSFEELRKRASSTRNDFDERLKVARKEVEDSEEITNFYIHNTEQNIYSGEENPLEFTIKNLEEFVQNILR